MVLVEKWEFFQVFFKGNIGQENVFYDDLERKNKENLFYKILERKNAFLGYKNKTFKRSKSEIFPKGLTHGFGPKMAFSSTFFFSQYRPGKCLL